MGRHGNNVGFGDASATPPLAPLRPLAEFELPTRPLAIVIGASTGGPQALPIVLKDLAPLKAHLSVLIALHIPSEFTRTVAARIETVSSLPTRLAYDGEPILPGHAYLSPGDRHISVARQDEMLVVRLLDTPPENFCKPSVDVLFRSAAEVFGAAVIGIVLTGMGSDGLAGTRAIVATGGTIVAQDAASSVVWGMPRLVASEGLAQAVLPLKDIGAWITRLVRHSQFREPKS
jgi:two-component system, chemotaxis family, protein-glutamate methylesterase/glutaminase